MRKMFAQRDGYEGAYIGALGGESLCIDGWVNRLSLEESAALQRLYDETAEEQT